VDRREQLLGHNMPLFYRNPVQIVRGEGVWLYDEKGNALLDMYNNVPCAGHCHPHVVKAIQKQVAILNVHSRYLHEGILNYTDRLTALHAEGLSSAVFTCSGSEANEVALNMARIATEGRGIICTDAAYHGNTAEVARLTRRGGEQSREIRSIPFPQCYRPIKDNLTPSALTDLYLAELESAIEAFTKDGTALAGMLLCPILANEGLPNIPPGFMPRAAKLIREAGGLVIADEVQSGFCRTGCWWGYELMDFEPDIAVMGKPMGNGIPFAGVVAGTELVNIFRDSTKYFNTFASSPLQAAAGMAVLDVIESENIRQNVIDVGKYLANELSQLQESCPFLGEVRGRGLFIGLEWVRDRSSRTADPEGAYEIVNCMRNKGILISNAGALRNIIKIRPPLVLQKEDADLFLTAFEESMREFDGAI